MNVNTIILNSNPFIQAYLLTDAFGKLIFISLLLLSIFSWIILIYKSWITFQVRKNSLAFQNIFESQKHSPLGINTDPPLEQTDNSFMSLYLTLRNQALEILNKNRLFGSPIPETMAGTPDINSNFLSPNDIAVIESKLSSSISSQTKNLEKHLYILSTIVSLAPFIGLLGTVWGILTTFSDLQAHTGGGSHQMVLGGLSMALATTVLGLLDAIPALIGYNYLKNSIGHFQTEMESFATEILTSLEMQYRKID